MHHRPAGPSRSARLSAAVRRTRRLLFPTPRRTVPMLVLGVTLAVLGIAAPVVSEAGTGDAGVSLDSSASASASPLRDGGIRMGADGIPAEGPSSGNGGTAAGSAPAGSATSAPRGSLSPATTPGATTAVATVVAGGGSPGSATGATTGTTAATGTTTGAPLGTPSASPAPATPPSTSVPGTVTAPESPASPPTVAPLPGATDAVLVPLNAARATAGCAALVADAGLTDVAQAHSSDMADAGGLSVSGLGGRTAVVAQGPADAASAVALWLADPTDRGVLLDCGRTSLGAGEASGTAGPWWTAILS